LTEGEDKFRECIEYLNRMNPIPPIELCEDLKVKVPKEIENWSKHKIFAELLGEKKATLAESYIGYQFQFDIGWTDPEVSAIMQIVDDNNAFKGSRRENILNKAFSLVGITNQKKGKKNCVYLLFAKSTKS